MEHELDASFARFRSRLILTYVFLALGATSIRILSGDLRVNFPWTLLGWVWAVTYGLILWYGMQLCVPPRTTRRHRGLCLAPAAVQLFQDAIDWYWSWLSSSVGFAQAEWINTFLRPSGFALDIVLLYLGLRFLRLAYTARAAGQQVLTLRATPADREATTVPVPESVPLLLGLGAGTTDRVIRSVGRRAEKAERLASFSMNIMLTLVFVGGMASFGLWLFTHTDRIGTLETELNKLSSLQAELVDLSGKLSPAADKDVKERLDRILNYIQQTYKSGSSLETVLNRLSVQGQTSGSDIAIRVTIAVLTLFLVQVFFAVHRYNQQLTAALATKAEALELIADDEEALKALRTAAVDIVKESPPGFGPAPRTVVEEVLRASERLAKRGPGG